MKDNNWNPGHNINKGYPFIPPISRAMFPNRLHVAMDFSNSQIFIGNLEHFPSNPVWPEKRTEVESFLMDRLYDYSEALKQSEGQIEDMLRESPFIPEDFGFEIVAPQDFRSMPSSIFESKWAPGTCLWRRPSEKFFIEGDDSAPINVWTISKIERDLDGEVKTTMTVDLNLSCRRIAFAALSALMIPLKDPNAKEEVAPEGMYDVIFQRFIEGKGSDMLIIEGVMAETDALAVDAAMEWMKINRPDYENLERKEFSIKK